MLDVGRYQSNRLEYKIVLNALLLELLMMKYHTTGHFYPSADIIRIRFESATYVINETGGAFDGMRLVSSKPFPKDTQVTISFEDESATGMSSMDTHEYT